MSYTKEEIKKGFEKWNEELIGKEFEPYNAGLVNPEDQADTLIAYMNAAKTPPQIPTNPEA